MGKLHRVATDMSMDEYLSLKDYDQRSYLTAVSKGGGEVQEWVDTGHSLFGGNASTKRGSEFDDIITRILQGSSFDAAVSVAPDEVLASNGARTTKAFKEWAQDKTGVILNGKLAWQYRLMYDNMRKNPSVCRIMDETTHTQVTVLFDIDGHNIKVRPDGVCPTYWWDLKTTSHTWDRLFYSVRDYGYDDQAWLYTEGAMCAGHRRRFRYPFVFVQAEPPYRSRAFYLPDLMVEEAGRRMMNTMEVVRLRRETGMYEPADLDEIQELYVPERYLRAEEFVEL